MDAKWSVHLSRCRHNYRCCPRKWLATPPGDGDAWFSMEFKTWAEAMAYVWREIADGLIRT